MDQNNEDYTKIVPKSDRRSFQPHGHDWSFLVRGSAGSDEAPRSVQVPDRHRVWGPGVQADDISEALVFQVSNDGNRIGVTVTMQFPG